MNNSNLNYEEELVENSSSILPEKTLETIGKYLLADGFPIVLDLVNSRGIKIVDEITGNSYIDFFTFFASNALGMNHPKINNEIVKQELATAAVNKPSNSDIYTTFMAEFIQTFARVAKPDYMKHLFFISGGTLAVENALKVAFDWKVRKNFEKGYKDEKGHQIVHFKEAFHGRSGYTMSLTNTEANKVNYFPKFNWPRVSNPKIIFPLDQNIDQIKKHEENSINEIYAAIKSNPDEIAAIIIEPIQGEGGDNFFRKEFFENLRKICDDNDIMLIFDEVQTGFGITGKFWASEHYVKPDIIAFGKKAQVCGIMVSDRVNEVAENVFKKSSRINSTWGGNLVDMVRSKHILNVIEEENLVHNSELMGKYLLNKSTELQKEFPELISNARGLGLMCSFDFTSGEIRNKFKDKCFEEKLIILGCGVRSIRFRTPLTVTKDDLDEGLKIIKKVLTLLS